MSPRRKSMSSALSSTVCPDRPRPPPSRAGVNFGTPGSCCALSITAPTPVALKYPSVKLKIGCLKYGRSRNSPSPLRERMQILAGQHLHQVGPAREHAIVDRGVTELAMQLAPPLLEALRQSSPT